MRRAPRTSLIPKKRGKLAEKGVKLAEREAHAMMKAVLLLQPGGDRRSSTPKLAAKATKNINSPV
jgi:hypothetical protein